MPKQKLMDRARDELFSHINRCDVLQAAPDDQTQWMDETIEYLGERYPDLGSSDLAALHTVGMRFCQPAIPHGERTRDDVEEGGEGEAEDTPRAVEDANAA